MFKKWLTIFLNYANEIANQYGTQNLQQYKKKKSDSFTVYAFLSTLRSQIGIAD